MQYTGELLKRILGKRVRITCVDMEFYVGIADDYVYADNNYNGKAGLIIETSDNRLIEFYEDEVLEIELYEQTVEKHIASIKKVRFKVWENGMNDGYYAITSVYEIFPDGKVFRYIYQGSSRKYMDKEVLHISENRNFCFFLSLVQTLTMDERDIVVCKVCDGSSYNLQITYIDGHKKVIEGDVGGGTYDKLMKGFIDSIFE